MAIISILCESLWSSTAEAAGTQRAQLPNVNPETAGGFYWCTGREVSLDTDTLDAWMDE